MASLRSNPEAVLLLPLVVIWIASQARNDDKRGMQSLFGQAVLVFQTHLLVVQMTCPDVPNPLAVVQVSCPAVPNTESSVPSVSPIRCVDLPCLVLEAQKNIPPSGAENAPAWRNVSCPTRAAGYETKNFSELYRALPPPLTLFNKWVVPLQILL
jgi:hypothetical protein